MEIDWVVLSQMFGSVAQGGGAIVVAVAAVAGLTVWRTQLRGTKRQAAAEDALSYTYKLQYMIEVMRHPFAWNTEMQNVPKLDGETEEQHRARAHWGVAEVRFAPFADDFAAMSSSRFKLQTLFGKETREAFERLLGMVSRVRNAAAQAVGASRQLDEMIRLAEGSSKWDVQVEGATERLRKLEEVVWGGGGEGDGFNREVAAAVAELEGYLKKDAGAS